ncbi:MAG: hypothetical protein WDA42_09010 [Candidatus Bathyarchaeia archaeon]
MSTALRQGIQYLTIYPENLLSLSLTSFGLLALTIFTAYFVKKSIGSEKLERVDTQTTGFILTVLGLIYFANYLNGCCLERMKPGVTGTCGF